MNPTIIVRSAVVALAVLIAACASDPKDEPPKLAQARTAAEERAAAEKLYRSAREALDSSDMTTALQRYDKLSQQFPFSDYATQGDLERIYALYRNFQPDQAIAAADRFVREHPRHAGAAYAQYLRGLVNSTRETGLTRYIGLDTTKEDVGYLRNAFDDFAVLVRKYPNSAYVGDARQRMIDLRNRVASHEMHIVRFYVKRGAYIAAAKRAEQVVTQYPGAPASLEALQLLQECYRALNLQQQADDAGRLQAALAQKQALNDYPTQVAVETLPATIREADHDKPVEDGSWLQQLLVKLGLQSPPTAAAATPTTPQTTDATPPKDPNLADILRATFGLSPSAAAPTAQPAPEQPASAPAAAAPPAPVVEDDSFTGRLNQFFNRERNEKDLAPGGRVKTDKTPLIKESPKQGAPEAPATTAPAPQTAAPPAKTSEPAPATPAEEKKKKGNWFTNLFSIFDTSEDEPYTIVIPTGKTPAAPQNPTGDASAPQTNPAASASAESADPSKSKGIRIEMEPYDDPSPKAEKKP